jgi:hypothetical protein
MKLGHLSCIFSLLKKRKPELLVNSVCTLYST